LTEIVEGFGPRIQLLAVTGASMSSDGSVAVWCVHRARQEGATAEVHCNYWRVAGDAEFKGRNGRVRDFLELGVWLSEPTQVAKVNIFLPFSLPLTAIEDCAPYFARVDIAQGIFNEPLTCNSRRGPQCVELIKEGTPFCRVHIFMTEAGALDERQLAVSENSGGTLLTITRQAIDEVCTNLTAGSPVYFRLRMYVDNKEPFVRTITPRDRLFQSGFDEVEYVDLRLNEARTLPNRVENLMLADAADRPVTLTRVAFLTAVPVLADVTLSSRLLHKSRLLEHNFWNDYVPSGIPDGMMVYHWREINPAGIKDFSAFVKMQTRRTGRQILKNYLTIAFAFGVLGNLTASAIEGAISLLASSFGK
jgi:hypothetical protein